MRRFFTFLKWVFITCIVFTAHAYLTGNTHIFATLNNTILKGRMAPPVDTKKIFPTRKINNGTPQFWVEDPKLGKLNLEQKYSDVLNQYQSIAFLVVQNGKILHEKYWDGYSAKSSTNPWSVTKSIVSILTGIAIKEGKIKNVEQNVSDFLPEFVGTGLKIKHLLTMSSGINFKEQYKNPYGYPAKALYGSDLENLNKKYRVNNIPGKHFVYLSGNTQVLGFVIKKATGKTISEYASEKLWKKIGAEKPAYWSLDCDGGNEKTFCCLHTNARDLARIGQLMLQHGVWGNDTLISENYYRASVSIAKLDKLNGKPNDFYGYGWYILKYKGLDIFYARGIKGQYVIIIPSKNLVVVRLGQEWNNKKIADHHVEFYSFLDAALSLIK